MSTSSTTQILNFCVSAAKLGKKGSSEKRLLEPLLEARSPDDSILECSPARQTINFSAGCLPKILRSSDSKNYTGIRLFNKNINSNAVVKEEESKKSDNSASSDDSFFQKQELHQTA